MSLEQDVEFLVPGSQRLLHQAVHGAVVHHYHPELRSTLMIQGAGVAKARDLGVIDMRQIAPTVAEMPGVSLTQAKMKPVHYQP